MLPTVASSASPVIAMVAGESSGDLLAGRLLSGLRPMLPDARLYGIGGQHMASHGFESRFPMESLTVHGLFEIIPRYREIKAIWAQLLEQLCDEKPDMFLGVDYSGFNLRLEEPLRKAGIPTMHFISPQVWASRRGRIKRIARSVDHMLVIFPFEEQIYKDAGIPVTYVGHPLAQVIPMVPDVAGAKTALGLAQDRRVVTLMPGSRSSELRHNTPGFLKAAKILSAREPGLQFVVPMAGEKQRDLFEQVRAEIGVELDIKVVLGQSHAAMAAADAVLVASGTASLEVALHKKPMVISYKVVWASYPLMRMLTYLPWIGLPNILEGEQVVPELLQYAATPEALADALWQQMDDPALQERLRQRFTDLHHRLLRDTAQESAQAVMQFLQQHGKI